tara:strand:+ start:372 stop:611 length:240 start_codon:yes stop_codon:yes gene_type:complete
MDKTKTIHLSVEEQVAMEHIEKNKEEDLGAGSAVPAARLHSEEDQSGRFFMYITEDQIREIVRDEINKLRPRGYNNYQE